MSTVHMHAATLEYILGTLRQTGFIAGVMTSSSIQYTISYCNKLRTITQLSAVLH